jgi:hypothetical protein
MCADDVCSLARDMFFPATLGLVGIVITAKLKVYGFFNLYVVWHAHAQWKVRRLSPVYSYLVL